ncbi:MAG: DMT family transporter [Granulosicoccus sp.]
MAIASGITAVIIWGWWMSATRVASTSGIAPIDIALLRYGIPAIMLCPAWLPMFRKLRKAPPWALLATLGWGAPFLWLVAASLETANVIYLATIVPCTMPLFALLGERVFFNIRPSRTQLCGFTLIGLAAVVVLMTALSGGGRIGLYSLSLMLLAAAGWACYVVAFRHTGLTAAQAAAWVCTMSTMLIVLVKVLSGNAFLALTIDQLLFHGMGQGVLSGFVAVILYTIAINRLGTARAASFTALIPLMGAGFAWALAWRETSMDRRLGSGNRLGRCSGCQWSVPTTVD